MAWEEGGAVLEWIFGLFASEEKRVAKVNALILQNMYKQAAIDVQRSALKASTARKVRSSILSESITTGRHASYMAKNRMGVAGVAVPSFTNIMQQYDNDRAGYYLEQDESLNKLAIYKHSSKKAVEMGQEHADIAASFDKVGSTINLLGSLMGKRGEG